MSRFRVREQLLAKWGQNSFCKRRENRRDLGDKLFAEGGSFPGCFRFLLRVGCAECPVMGDSVVSKHLLVQKFMFRRESFRLAYADFLFGGCRGRRQTPRSAGHQQKEAENSLFHPFISLHLQLSIEEA